MEAAFEASRPFATDGRRNRQSVLIIAAFSVLSLSSSCSRSVALSFPFDRLSSPSSSIASEVSNRSNFSIVSN
jgi:hypothetical protein